MAGFKTELVTPLSEGTKPAPGEGILPDGEMLVTDQRRRTQANVQLIVPGIEEVA